MIFRLVFALAQKLIYSGCPSEIEDDKTSN